MWLHSLSKLDRERIRGEKKKNQQIFYTELKLIQSGLKTNKQKTRMLFFFPDVMLQTLFESFNLPPRENHQEYIKYTFVL